MSGMAVGENQTYVGENLEPGRTQTLETAVCREKAKYSVTGHPAPQTEEVVSSLCRGKSGKGQIPEIMSAWC